MCAFEVSNLLNKDINLENETHGCIKYPLRALCCLTGIGCCYLVQKQVLIKEGEYGFAMNNGKPEILSTFAYIYEALGITSTEEDEFRQKALIL